MIYTTNTATSQYDTWIFLLYQNNLREKKVIQFFQNTMRINVNYV